MNKDKQIRELDSVLVFFIVLFLLTGIFMVVFLVMWFNTEQELQSCQDEKCKIYNNLYQNLGCNLKFNESSYNRALNEKEIKCVYYSYKIRDLCQDKSPDLSDISIFNNSKGEISVGVWSKNGELIPSEDAILQKLNDLISYSHSEEWQYYIYTFEEKYYINGEEVNSLKVGLVSYLSGDGVEFVIWNRTYDFRGLIDDCIDDGSLLYKLCEVIGDETFSKEEIDCLFNLDGFGTQEERENCEVLLNGIPKCNYPLDCPESINNLEDRDCIYAIKCGVIME